MTAFTIFSITNRRRSLSGEEFMRLINGAAEEVHSGQAQEKTFVEEVDGLKVRADIRWKDVCGGQHQAVSVAIVRSY